MDFFKKTFQKVHFRILRFCWKIFHHASSVNQIEISGSVSNLHTSLQLRKSSFLEYKGQKLSQWGGRFFFKIISKNFSLWRKYWTTKGLTSLKFWEKKFWFFHKKIGFQEEKSSKVQINLISRKERKKFFLGIFWTWEKINVALEWFYQRILEVWWDLSPLYLEVLDVKDSLTPTQLNFSLTLIDGSLEVLFFSIEFSDFAIHTTYIIWTPINM